MKQLELVWEKDCPNVGAARAVLRDALGQIGLAKQWQEWQIGVDALPAHAQGYGSPTILVDQLDVTGHASGGSDDCCRVYLTAEGLVGVPSVAAVVTRLLGERL